MQQQRGGGGAQFGVPPQQPGMPPFSPDGGAGPRISLAEAPSPISSRPPATAQQFDELGLPGGAGGAGGAGFDDEALAAAAGEEGAGSGAAGNRWPRQETLALLKIRSEMDGTFRDATLKGPLWEEVSRKLAELGYRRSAKKCKEKFENVHKYYKRTKESRAGRNDGKTYRFFTQLEALHGAASTTAPTPVASLAPPEATMTSPAPATAAGVGVSGVAGPSAVRAPAEPPPPLQQPPVGSTAMPTAVAGSGMPMQNISFSSNTSESDEEDSDDEGTEEMYGAEERGKRKRLSGAGAGAVPGGGGVSGKMMRFFDGLLKQVMERQEAMQQRFLEAIEKREQDRMIREEAWRRQEMARLAREQEILAQERAMAASRDAAVISFIQKITGQTIPLPSITAPAITVMPPPSQPQPHPTPIASATPVPPPSQPPASQPPLQPQLSPQPQKSPMPATLQPQQQQPPPPPPQHQSMDIVTVQTEPYDAAGGSGYDGSGSTTPSSRWPKAEVHALIQMRSNLEARYQEAGPKGPLWEEISAGMRRMGYNRSSKRCKEKWENINKYFKKVKESNKKRPEDSKTCPYFHQLDALYRNKALNASAAGAVSAPLPPEHESHTNAASQERTETITIAAPISQTAPQAQQVTKNSSNNGNGNGSGGKGGGGGSDGGGCSGGMQMQASNGSVAARFFGEGGGGTAAAAKKPEDIMKEMMEQRQHQHQPQQRQTVMNNSYQRMDGADSDNMDEDDDYDDDDDDDLDGDKMQYEIQFQRQQQTAVRPNTSSGGGAGNPPVTAAPGTAATTTGSFLAMVQ